MNRSTIIFYDNIIEVIINNTSNIDLRGEGKRKTYNLVFNRSGVSWNANLSLCFKTTSLVVIITMLLRNSLTKSLALKRLIAVTSKVNSTSNKTRLLSTPTDTFPTPILFDYETIKNNLTVADAIPSVEEAFAALANGKVDVPMPMHIGIEESKVAGPGDCHIKVRGT